MGRSITGVLVGILMFFGSFAVLWWNEGRQDLSEFVAQAVAVDAAAPGADQELVKTTAALSVAQPAADPEYLTPGDWLVLARKAQMFAWVEEKQTTTTKRGTQEVEETTYNYKTEWTADPQPASAFYEPGGHENPGMTVQSAEFRAAGVRIGAITVPFDQADYRGVQDLQITPQMLLMPAAYEAAGNMLYLRQGSAAAPSVGDQRLAYSFVPTQGQFTAVGGYAAGSLKPYIYEGSETFLMLAPGTAEALQALLHGEHVTTTWILRIVGFLLMWFGLAAIFAPLTTLLSFIPLIGGMGRGLVSLVMGVVALVLTALTIILAKLFWLLLILAVIGIVVMLVIGLSRRKKQGVAQPAG